MEWLGSFKAPLPGSLKTPVLFTQNAWALSVSGIAFPVSVPWPVALSLALHQ